ncbi:hypothetical protein [Janthinobacterium lividum]|uniref:hypothetical protein n=1 Tax=Janthinobacterium lividum TaxID=29581 RepID=UPI0014084950|nr:hypothetical protein [Janthinobacterium lividum]NHQ93682.1 hypothetical protein [Janthinobacterium lividum]
MATPHLVPLHRYLNAATGKNTKLFSPRVESGQGRQVHECDRDTGIDMDIAKEVICGAKSFPPTMLPEPVPALAATAAAFST